MRAKNKLKNMYPKFSAAAAIIVLAGFLLIITGFLLLTPGGERSPVSWLNMIVICVVYFVNIINIYDKWVSVKDFNSVIARLGLHWVVVLLYTIFAIAGLLYPWYGSAIVFKYLLFYQLVCLFALIVFYTVGNYSSAHAQNVQQGEDALQSGLQALRTKTVELEVTIQSLHKEWLEEQLMATKIKDDIRYLSPSALPQAAVLEKKIADEVETLKEMIAGIAPSREKIKAALNNCMDIINYRKQLFTN